MIDYSRGDAPVIIALIGILSVVMIVLLVSILTLVVKLYLGDPKRFFFNLKGIVGIYLSVMLGVTMIILCGCLFELYQYSTR